MMLSSFDYARACGELIIKRTVYSIPLLCGLLFISSLSGILIYEYLYFKHEAERMLELQEEYRTYLFAVKKVIEEYNTFKDSHQLHDEKKKLNLKKSNEQFIQLNRDLGYLKDSSSKFYQEYGIPVQALREIDEECWQDYDPSVHEITQSRATQARRTRRRRVVTRNTSPTSALIKNDETSESSVKHDISFIWPIRRDRFWISSFFGPRKKPNGAWGFHQGIDLAALKGTPVKAAQSGIVVEATEKPGFGKTILISHTNKYKTRYAHLNSIHVKVGQKVEQGEFIGRVGDTGLVRSKGKDASHLHFEVYLFGKRVNPMYYLR